MDAVEPAEKVPAGIHMGIENGQRQHRHAALYQVDKIIGISGDFERSRQDDTVFPSLEYIDQLPAAAEGKLLRVMVSQSQRVRDAQGIHKFRKAFRLPAVIQRAGFGQEGENHIAGKNNQVGPGAAHQEADGVLGFLVRLF